MTEYTIDDPHAEAAAARHAPRRDRAASPSHDITICVGKTSRKAGMYVVNLEIDPPTYKALIKIAEEDGRTLAGVIRRSIRSAINFAENAKLKRWRPKKI